MRKFDAKEITKLLDLLIGPTEAVGESNADEKAMENLKVLIDVTKWCLDGILHSSETSRMNVTLDPVLTVMDFSPEDKIYRVEVRGEKVIDFSASSGWTITKGSVTKDRRTLVLTVEKGEEDGELV